MNAASIKISEASSKYLLSFYNVNILHVEGGTTIKKFTNRKTAERRVDELMSKLFDIFPETPAFDHGFMPAEGFDYLASDANEKVETFVAEPIVAETVEEAAEALEEPESISGVFGNIAKSIARNPKEATAAFKSLGKASNSDGVAASWANENTRITRLTRDGVSVECDGEDLGTFKSTRDAFRAFRLPDSKHIRFRLKLKEANRERGEGLAFEQGGKSYVFRIVPTDENTVFTKAEK